MVKNRDTLIGVGLILGSVGLAVLDAIQLGVDIPLDALTVVTFGAGVKKLKDAGVI